MSAQRHSTDAQVVGAGCGAVALAPSYHWILTYGELTIHGAQPLPSPLSSPCLVALTARIDPPGRPGGARHLGEVVSLARYPRVRRPRRVGWVP